MPSFIAPLFLIGSLAAAVPLVLHLLMRQPEPRVKFAAVRLLKGAPVELSEKRRLRELWLLALRVAALVLLALAFARPFLASRVAAPTGTTIVALDTSFSMSAPGTFARAQQLAKGAIDRAGAGELVGVVTFDDAPIVAMAPGTDRGEARAAIDAAAPGFGATRYRAAIGTAVQALGGRRGTIVVVTDLQESGWDVGDRVSVPEPVRIEAVDVGGLQSNLAIVGLRSAGDRIIASVVNSGSGPRDTRAQLALDGRAAGASTVTVGAGLTVDVEFNGASRASTVTVTIDDREGPAADNVRYAVLDHANPRRVLLVTSSGNLHRDALYVEQALSAGAAGGVTYETHVLTPAQLAAVDAGPLKENAVVILLSSRGLERRGREVLASYVTSGGGLLLAVGPDVDGEVVADVLGTDAPLRISAPADAKSTGRSLVVTDARHPIFQPFAAETAAFGLATFRRVAEVEGPRCQSIARFTTGEAALLSCEAGAGRAIVIASDLDNRWNDAPLRASFVPFVHETLKYLSSVHAPIAEYRVADVPTGMAPVPGFATRTDGGGVHRVAVNVDPRESDASRLSVEEFQRAVTRRTQPSLPLATAEAQQQEEGQHLWMYALGLMVAVLAAEAVLASRTA
jgi:hypothetical protein